MLKQWTVFLFSHSSVVRARAYIRSEDSLSLSLHHVDPRHGAQVFTLGAKHLCSHTQNFKIEEKDKRWAEAWGPITREGPGDKGT